MQATYTFWFYSKHIVYRITAQGQFYIIDMYPLANLNTAIIILNGMNKGCRNMNRDDGIIQV